MYEFFKRRMDEYKTLNPMVNSKMKRIFEPSKKSLCGLTFGLRFCSSNKDNRLNG